MQSYATSLPGPHRPDSEVTRVHDVPRSMRPPPAFLYNCKEKENSIMHEWLLHFLPEYAAVYIRIHKYARRPCYIRSYSTKWCSLSTDSPDYSYIRPYAPDAGGEVNGLKTCYWRLGSKFWLYNEVRNVGKSLLTPSVSGLRSSPQLDIIEYFISQVSLTLLIWMQIKSSPLSLSFLGNVSWPAPISRAW